MGPEAFFHKKNKLSAQSILLFARRYRLLARPWLHIPFGKIFCFFVFVAQFIVFATAKSWFGDKE